MTDSRLQLDSQGKEPEITGDVAASEDGGPRSTHMDATPWRRPRDADEMFAEASEFKTFFSETETTPFGFGDSL